ncbi:hypothetical protein ABZ192_23040 [Streptomyces sp. NPDC006235]|uniref:hypothetical protein n=1 Tax=Streptomyces sp. NPDC006235 TaxID=3156736 RepID=UPI0033A20681
MNKNRVIASTVLVGALIGAAAPAATAATPAPARSVAQVQTVDTHRAVSSAAEVRIATPATSTHAATGSTTASTTASAAAETGEFAAQGRISWLIGKLKGLGSTAWNKLKAAAKSGYTAFKKAYEKYVPWLVRKAIEVGYTVYEVYTIVKDFVS